MQLGRARRNPCQAWLSWIEMIQINMLEGEKIRHMIAGNIKNVSGFRFKNTVPCEII